MQMQWPSDLVVAAPYRADAVAALSRDWAVRAVRTLLPGEGHPPHARAPGDPGSVDVVRSEWPEVGAALLQIRRAFLARFPGARNGFTLGDLERLLTVVVAVPGYQLARQQGPRLPASLHPVLDTLLRTGDILRRATRQLRLRPEQAVTPFAHSRVRAADILSFIERQQRTEAALTQLFLRTALEGETDPLLRAVSHAVPVQQALQDLDAAFDYALLGLQASAVVAALGPLLARTHAPVAAILHASKQGSQQPMLDRLQGWARDVDALLQDHGLDAAGGRVMLETIHADTYAQCVAGLGDPVRQSLWARLAGEPADVNQAAAEKLRMVLRRRCSRAEAGAVEWLLDCLMHTFTRIQQVLALAEEIQQRIDALLPSPGPRHARGTADLQHDLFQQDGLARRLPMILAELERVLGLRASITAASIDIRAVDDPPGS